MPDSEQLRESSSTWSRPTSPWRAANARSAAPAVLTEPETRIGVVDDSYRGVHRAPGNDDYCNSLDRLAESFGADVYDHPEFYGSGESDPETMAQLLAARGNPEATVAIYRAVPSEVKTINAGDWVSLSRAYAERHAIQDDDEANDWPVITRAVKAADVWTDGNDLAEFGYDPAPAGSGNQDRLSELEQPVSPQMAAGVAASARARGAVGEEFGWLTAAEASRLLGSSQPGGAYANDQRKDRKALGVPVRNTYTYPGFQFTDAGRVHSAVTAVLRAADDLDVDADTVAQWFCLPSAGLDGDRPVDVLDEPQAVLDDFTGRFGAQW